nr:hypothetical protein [Tanacetum cinerariifolium]
TRNQEFHKLRRHGGGQSATHNPTTAAAAAGSCCCRCSGGGGVGGDEWWGYGGSEWRWWRWQRDLIDRATRSKFGVRQKILPEKFSDSGGWPKAKVVAGDKGGGGGE